MSDKSCFKFAFIFLFLSLIALNFASADACNLKVTLLNQDPYPANPGDYVKVVFQVAGVGNSNCRGEIFELNPSYPFSLDENESAVRTLETMNYSDDYNTNWIIPYTLRIDKNALDGEAEIKVVYRFKNWDPAYSINQKFNITIQNSQTNFDAVIQDISGSDVSIAIANIGKYAANAVIVKIPEQDSFITKDVSGQMVGNLDSGDYTVVGFSLSQKMGQMIRTTAKTSDSQPSVVNTSSNTLKFDIYYTDNIGERRVVGMELPLSLSNSSGLTGMAGGFSGRKRSSWSIWYTLLIIAAVFGIIAFILLKKFPKKTKAFLVNIKMKFKRNKKAQVSNQIPDWIKNSKMNESLKSSGKEKEKK
jgi:hypothetical protein